MPFKFTLATFSREIRRPSLLLVLCLLFGIHQGRAQDSLDVQVLGKLSYPNAVLINDVWGYADPVNNKEYALVGVWNGLSIVDVTNPASPTELHFIPGAATIWRDIKTYRHYAYAVHDNVQSGGSGILIVDLTTLNDTIPTYYSRKPSVPIDSVSNRTFNNAHNIYIDTVAGQLFTFDGGAKGNVIFDIATDPTNPALLGVYTDHDLHDGVVRGDTLWGAAMFDGAFVVADVSDPANPVTNASKATPLNFSHNIWFSDNNQRVWTTDEVDGAWIAEYDVSDLNNIDELDRIKSSLGANAVPHNVHYYNDFLVNSFYTSGLQILDVSQPGLMVETGFYDTSPDTGGGFNGCWGAYPYLPSGNILATDMEEGLFILKSDYTRGCYLYLNVVDSLSRQNLINAQVEILNTSMSGNTDIFGEYKDGYALAGSYQLVAQKQGYQTDTFSVNLQNGLARNKQIALLPSPVGLNEMKAFEALHPYPNPISVNEGIIRIAAWTDALEEVHYQFLSSVGGILEEGELQNGYIELGNSKFPEGSYFLQIRYQNFVRTYPILLR